MRHVAFLLALLPMPLAAQQDAPTITAPSGVFAPGEAYEGRIRLTRFLDEPDGYCLDIPGGPGRRIEDVPMWVHTCHMFAWPDQVVRVAPEGGLVFDGDLCLTADALEAGAGFDLAACDGRPEQDVALTDAMQLRIGGTDLCVHVAGFGPSPFGLSTNGEDRFGRGVPINPPMSHLARPLTALPCASGDPGFSRWTAMPEPG
jgi:hypothetical protein